MTTDHHHDHGDGHGHSHGLIDPSIVRSHEGVNAVAISLAVLALAAIAQLVDLLASGSVALLADLIHNFGDALTAIPLGDRVPAPHFAGSSSPDSRSSPRSFSPPASRSTRRSSASSTPQSLTHLWALAVAG